MGSPQVGSCPCHLPWGLLISQSPENASEWIRLPPGLPGAQLDGLGKNGEEGLRREVVGAPEPTHTLWAAGFREVSPRRSF